MKGGSFLYSHAKVACSVPVYERKIKMKTNEHDYYSSIANWSFDDIDCIEENFTNWCYEEEIKNHVNPHSKILDLGTAGGEKVIACFPEVVEIIATDFSKEMIATANQNLAKSGRKEITFRVMDNLHMDTPKNYFDLVTARHTVTNPKQIYETLKEGGYLIVRGVDKLDCWALKRLFGRGQAYHDRKPISVIDFEAMMDAGFKDVELVPIHVVEYYKTKEDLFALLAKTPILDNFSEEKNGEYERVPIEKDLFEAYVKENMCEKGIRLMRRYYGIVGRK